MKNLRNTPELSVSRRKLRNINHRILRLLAERNAVVEQVAMRKNLDGIPIVRSDVEEACFADIRAYAEELGLDPEYASAVFQLMLGQAYKVEIMHSQQGKKGY